MTKKCIFFTLYEASLTTGEGVHLLEMKKFDFNFIFTKSSEMIMGFLKYHSFCFPAIRWRISLFLAVTARKRLLWTMRIVLLL